MIRKLTLADFEAAYQILLEVRAWLHAKGIKQWETPLAEWEIPMAHPVNWLSTMAISRSFAGQAIGGRILAWVLRHIEKPLFWDCVAYGDVLPQFYRSNGFREVKRKHLYGSPMVLMEAI